MDDSVSNCIFMPNIFVFELGGMNILLISLSRLEKICHWDSGVDLRLG